MTDRSSSINSMDRRRFLTASTLTAFSVSTFGKVLRNSNGDIGGDCETTNDILGPFYRPDAPIRKDLLFEGITGTRILLTGRVLDDDCTTPLNNAQVEIWHCDGTGWYDNDTSEFKHRARWKTDEKGEYSFRTILPGKYLNGQLYRPSHIHYRVTEKDHHELISQIYFSGDPHIPEDPWASHPKALKRILPISPVGLNGDLQITFDIQLGRK